MNPKWLKQANRTIFFFLLLQISLLTADQVSQSESEPQVESENEDDLTIDFPQPPPVPFTVESSSESVPTTTVSSSSQSSIAPIPIQRIKIFPVYRKGVGYCCRGARKSNGKKPGK